MHPLRRRSDDPADRLVATGRWRAFEAALDGGPAFPELAAVLAPAVDPPAWLEPELLDAGAVAWWRAGLAQQTVALLAGSLAFGYGSSSLARPLAATGRLTRMAPRRLGETTRWIVEVTRPGAMRPGGPGVRSVVRLRLVHALVRAHLRPGWDVEAWGEPISLGDVLATGLGGFFLVPLRALEDLGVRYSPAELEALFHLWRWITHLMGVPDEDLPATLPAARAEVETILAGDPGPGEDSAALMRALLFHGLDYDRRLPRPLAGVARQTTAHVLAGFVRRWMDPETADALAVPDTPLKRLVPLTRPLTLGRELARSAGVLGSDRRIVALETATLDRLLTLAGTAPEVMTPEHVELKRA